MSATPAIGDPLRYVREFVTVDDDLFRVFEGENDANPMTISFDRGEDAGDEIGWYGEWRHGDSAEWMSVVDVLLAVGPHLGEVALERTEGYLAEVRAGLVRITPGPMHDARLRQCARIDAELATARNLLPELIRAVQQAHMQEAVTLAQLDARLAHSAPDPAEEHTL